MTEGKQKLTLSVDAESVERAKSLGINISELTEQVLRTFALRPEDVEANALQTQRQSLFDEMTPLLKKLRCETQVGVVSDPTGNTEEDFLDVVLVDSGKIVVLAPDGDPDYDFFHDDVSKYGTVYFDSPELILRNFMKAIEDAKGKRKKEIASFVLARKIVEAVAQVESGVKPSTPPTGANGGRTSRSRSADRRGRR